MAAAEGKSVHEVELPDEVVSSMQKGEAAPWHVGSHAYGVCMLFGRRLFMAENDLARCKEQLSMMDVEKDWLCQWLEVTSARVNERLQEVKEKLVEGGQLEPWQLLKEHGLVFWLEWHARRLAGIRAEAQRQLSSAR